MTKKQKSVELKFHAGQLVALEIAIRLRIEALVENNQKDMTYGWKVLHRKVIKAMQEV